MKQQVQPCLYLVRKGNDTNSGDFFPPLISSPVFFKVKTGGFIEFILMHKHRMMLILLILTNSTLSLAHIIFSQYSDEKIDLF